jgi:hypothetical protein
MEIVIVERIYDPPITQAEIDEKMSGGPVPCYALRNVTHVMSVISLDGRRAICMYEAPDAASVRQASEENGDPFERVWTGTRVGRFDAAR